MVEVYVSWCEGLPENKEALKVLRDSGIVDGIETSEKEDIEKIHSEDLKANIHRPFRDNDFNLEDKEFPEYAGKEIERYNKSDSPVLGFHLINHKKECEAEKEDILERIKDNIEKLDSVFKQDIVFEISPYWSEFVKLKGEDNMEYFTGKEIISDLLKNTSAGVLLDISHVFVGGMNKIKNGLFNGTIEDYFNNLLDVSKEKVLQLHVNVPIKKEKEYEDAHKTFEDDEISEKIIQIMRLVLEKCPNISVITLEIDTGLSPVEHARKMVGQAEKLNEKLDLKREIKAYLEK